MGEHLKFIPEGLESFLAVHRMCCSSSEWRNTFSSSVTTCPQDCIIQAVNRGEPWQPQTTELFDGVQAARACGDDGRRGVSRRGHPTARHRGVESSGVCASKATSDSPACWMLRSISRTTSVCASRSLSPEPRSKSLVRLVIAVARPTRSSAECCWNTDHSFVASSSACSAAQVPAASTATTDAVGTTPR